MSPLGWWKVLEERRLRDRPRALRFAMLTILWAFPSLGALWILIINRRVWSEAGGFAAALANTRLEQWIALACLAAHLCFAYLALRYARKEAVGTINQF